MNDRLADQETVERIVVQLGQEWNVERRLFLQRQGFNAMGFPLICDELRWIGFGERQFANRILERDFP